MLVQKQNETDQEFIGRLKEENARLASPARKVDRSKPVVYSTLYFRGNDVATHTVETRIGFPGIGINANKPSKWQNLTRKKAAWIFDDLNATGIPAEELKKSTFYCQLAILVDSDTPELTRENVDNGSIMLTAWQENNQALTAYLDPAEAETEVEVEAEATKPVREEPIDVE